MSTELRKYKPKSRLESLAKFSEEIVNVEVVEGALSTLTYFPNTGLVQSSRNKPSTALQNKMKLKILICVLRLLVAILEFNEFV